MSRYRLYGLKDDQPQEDGDATLLGVDERRGKDTANALPQGLCARAVNKDFRNACAETRRGIQTVRWGGEPAFDFPINFIGDHDMIGLITASPASWAGLNYRIYNGTTLQFRNVAPAGWHSVWLQDLGGATVIAVDLNGMPDSQWAYAAYNMANANFRLLDDTTFQLRNVSTGLWHTVYILTVGGQSVLSVDQNGMTDNQAHAPAQFPNFTVRQDTTFQLCNTDFATWHAVFVEPVGGIATLAIDIEGTTEEGFDFDKVVGFGKVYGTLDFSDPYGQQGSLIAVPTGVVRLMPNNEPIYVRLPNEDPITGPVKLIQAFDRVLLLRGGTLTNLVWNPVNDMAAVTNGFEEIVITTARVVDPNQNTTVGAIYADGTQAMPSASEGTFFNNRVYLIQGRAQIVVSDVFDYTRYGVATSKFAISEGDADQLIVLVPAPNNSRTTLVCFKDRSIHALANLTGDLSGTTNQVLTKEYGCIAARSAIADGTDIYFMSEGGVRSIGQLLDGNLQLNADPLSGPIQPIIDRINWKAASGIAGAYSDNKLYWAVPLDGANFNNAVIVFDGITKTWSGSWTNSFMDVHSFVRTNFIGRRRLFAVNADNLDDRAANGSYSIVGEGYTDQLYVTEYQIEDEVIIGGYARGKVQRQRVMTMLLDVGTWNAKYTVEALGQGVNAVKTLERDRTLDRTKYRVWGKAKWDPSNTNDDHAAEDREDYSVLLNTTTNPGLSLGDNGVAMGLHQRVELPYRVDARDNFVRIRITNKQGRCNVYGADLQLQDGERHMRTRS